MLRNILDILIHIHAGTFFELLLGQLVDSVICALVTLKLGITLHVCMIFFHAPCLAFGPGRRIIHT